MSLLLFKCASRIVLRDKRVLRLNVPPPLSSVDPFMHNSTLFLEVCAFTAHLSDFISLTSTEGLRLCADVLHTATRPWTHSQQSSVSDHDLWSFCLLSSIILVLCPRFIKKKKIPYVPIRLCLPC